jgi:NAD(P)-dependent dehydrogenase (short-subunit alcohol dehydrogenase family)
VTDFDGLRLLVTGSSTGLGAATAVGAARRGARGIVVNYVSSKGEADATADECRAAGAEVRVVQANVAEDADCRRLAEAAAGWGGLDALVNNAAVTKAAPDHADLDALSAEDFHRIYGVNLVGAYQMIRACRPLLEAACDAVGRASAVVNVSSIAAFNGTGSSVAYAASKGAVNTMTISLARALAPKIRVNAVCPGLIDTVWFSKLPAGESGRDKLRAWAIDAMPLKAAATAEDVAEVALFLAGPASRNMTGERVEADTGFHLIAPTPHRDVR